MFPKIESLLLFLSLILFAFTYEEESSSSEEEDGNWQCGTDFLTKTMSEGQIETDCPTLKDPINNCCIAHDLCYDEQRGRKYCDDIFCKCLLEASRPSSICHKEDAPLFCALVVKFGDEAYVASGNKTNSTPYGEILPDHPKASILIPPRPPLPPERPILSPEVTRGPQIGVIQNAPSLLAPIFTQAGRQKTIHSGYGLA